MKPTNQVSTVDEDENPKWMSMALQAAGIYNITRTQQAELKYKIKHTRLDVVVF